MNIKTINNNEYENLKNLPANKKSTEKSVNIKANSLNMNQDLISQKREDAQKKAMKIISDAFSGDKKIDDDIAARRKRVQELNLEIGDYSNAIKSIENQREALRSAYNIDPESQEEKNLQLLAKAKEAEFEGSDVVLSSEEQKRVKELKDNGLTQYQKLSLELKEYEAPYYTAMKKAEDERYMENAINRGIKIERLKSNPMQKAQKEAESVLEEADKEIIGMAMEEAKENIDETQTEEMEKAKEKKEKEEELQERIDSVKEKRKEQEELTENILEDAQTLAGLTNKLEEAQQEVKELMNKMKLVEEDIKGAKVDKEV